jgi:hypothetical protein
VLAGDNYGRKYSVNSPKDVVNVGAFLKGRENYLNYLKEMQLFIRKLQLVGI